MEAGDVLGHEPMGVVVEVGKAVTKLKKGDRVVVPFTISCGELLVLPEGSCSRSATPRTRTPRSPARRWASRRPACSATRTCSAASPAARPSTCACPSPTSARSRSPTACPTRRSLFLSDIFPTGYMAAENAEIEPGDTVAVWGCGPVGAVRHPERLDARRRAGDRHRPRAGAAARWPQSTARPRRSTSRRQDVYDTLMEMTKGRGPGPLHRRGRVPRRTPPAASTRCSTRRRRR